jgi:hypothetical protein
VHCNNEAASMTRRMLRHAVRGKASGCARIIGLNRE